MRQPVNDDVCAVQLDDFLGVLPYQLIANCIKMLFGLQFGIQKKCQRKRWVSSGKTRTIYVSKHTQYVELSFLREMNVISHYHRHFHVAIPFLNESTASIAVRLLKFTPKQTPGLHRALLTLIAFLRYFRPHGLRSRASMSWVEVC
jgi:hypothetical protein